MLVVARREKREKEFKPHERLAGARLAVNFVMNFEEGSEPSFNDGDGFTEAALPSLNGHLGGISAYKGAQLMSCWSKWHEP